MSPSPNLRQKLSLQRDLIEDNARRLRVLYDRVHALENEFNNACDLGEVAKALIRDRLTVLEKSIAH